nr:hypothetical protein CFP56_18424 [Quercus suber]
MAIMAVELQTTNGGRTINLGDALSISEPLRLHTSGPSSIKSTRSTRYLQRWLLGLLRNGLKFVVCNFTTKDFNSNEVRSQSCGQLGGNKGDVHTSFKMERCKIGRHNSCVS